MGSYRILSITLFLLAFARDSLCVRNMYDKTISQDRASNARCNTSLCVELANDIRERIDESKNPCDDFYAFACGAEVERRQAELKADPSAPERSNAYDTRKMVERKISKILDGSITIPGNSIGKYVKVAHRYHAQCMEKISNPKDSLEEVIELIEFVDSLFGDWAPGDNWEKDDFTKFSEMIGILAKTNFPSPIELAEQFDEKNPSKGKLVKIAPNLKDLVDMKKTLSTMSFQFELRYQKTELLPEYFSNRIFMPVVFELIDLMEQTTTWPSVEPRNFSHLAGLKQWWEGKEGAQFGLLDWDVVFHALSPGVHEAVRKGAQHPYTKSIAVTSTFKSFREPIAFGKALTILHTLGPKKILTLVKTTALAHALKHDNEIAQKRQFVGRFGLTAESLCTDHISQGPFDMLLSAAFIRLPELSSDLVEKKKKSKEIVENLRAAFIANLDDLDWLDNKTAEFAAEKARAMGAKLLYPDWLVDDAQVGMVYADVPRIEHLRHYNVLDLALSGWKTTRALREVGVKPYSIFWASPPIVLNMIYNPLVNDIAAMAAFVQPPMSSSRAMGASLFGNLGAVMGHEMTHGFDTMGHKRDALGEPHDWWDSKTKQHFEEKTKCFVDQVGQMEFDGHKMANCFGRNCNGNHATSVAKRTLGENIADVGGLGISWLAYRQWMRENGQDLPLEGLEYSTAQIFFMEFARSHCGAAIRQYKEYMLETDEHLIPELRMNSAVKNSIPFAKAFKCAQDAPMNPENKCRIWGAVPDSEMP